MRPTGMVADVSALSFDDEHNRTARGTYKTNDNCESPLLALSRHEGAVPGRP